MGPQDEEAPMKRAGYRWAAAMPQTAAAKVARLMIRLMLLAFVIVAAAPLQAASLQGTGVVFLHGGLRPEVAALGCDAINDQVRREVGADIEKTLGDTQSTLAAGENGPLWFRGLARGEGADVQALTDGVLQALRARAIVIGHTVTGTGRIEVRLGGRVVMIDAGMTDAYGGHAAALEIDGQGRMTAIYPDRREPLEQPAAARLLVPPVPRSEAFSLAAASAGALQ